MIRSLTPFDIVRLANFRNSEWLVRRGLARERIPRSVFSDLPPFKLKSFLSDRVTERRRETIFGLINEGDIMGLASACQRNGSTSWGVRQLAISNGGEKGIGDLLSMLGSHAGRHGAERLFLLLPDEARFVDVIRRSGFLLGTALEVYTLVGRDALVGGTQAKALRLRLAADDYSLYRLYNASTPLDVREGTGMTLQQWVDAQELRGKRTRELVVEEGGSIWAWVRLDSELGCVRVQSMVHPLWKGDLGGLVAFVLTQVNSRRVLWEVPTHQGSLRLVLERVGFQMSGTYRLMVKLLVVQVKESAQVAAVA